MKVKVKLFQDDKIHEYNKDIAERLEASGRCKILGTVGVKAIVANSKKAVALASAAAKAKAKARAEAEE